MLHAVSYAFDEMGKAGYQVSSAYTLVKDRAKCKFVYRDSLWHGADMFGTGVASFGHVGGVHHHTSVIRTLRQRWRLGPPLTSRDLSAPDLAPVLSLDAPRPPESWRRGP